MKLRLLSAVTLAAGLADADMADPGCINGDFETGVLSPWVVTPTQNGRTLHQDVVSFDVTGTGAALAGHFGVGQVNLLCHSSQATDHGQRLVVLSSHRFHEAGIPLEAINWGNRPTLTRRLAG